MFGAAAALLFILVLGLVGGAIVARHVANQYSTTSAAKGKKPFNFTLKQNASHENKGPTISIVIPCYNEEERLPAMLRDTICFCEQTVKRCTSDEVARSQGLFSDFEIIVVNDCSKDNTAQVAERTAAEAKESTSKERVKVVHVNPNRGKGFAVRTGFFAASGDYVLMADGDGATEIADLSVLLKAIRNLPSLSSSARSAPVIAVGSRAHLEQDSMAKRTLGRTILMKLFHFVVAFTYFCATLGKVCPIRDTQCGFKLFLREATEVIFLNNRLERWAFDVELLLLACRCNMSVVECAVRWQEIPGSKVNIKGMAQMGLECLLMCFTYPLQFWEIKGKRN